MSEAFQEVYRMSSLPRSINDSLIVVYDDGTDVVPNCRYKHIRDSFPTIATKFDDIRKHACTWLYSKSRSISPYED